MSHSLYELYQTTLQQQIAPACWPLMQAIFSCAQPNGQNEGVSLAEKSAVLAQLAKLEGVEPSLATIR